MIGGHDRVPLRTGKSTLTTGVRIQSESGTESLLQLQTLIAALPVGAEGKTVGPGMSAHDLTGFCLFFFAMIFCRCGRVMHPGHTCVISRGITSLWNIQPRPLGPCEEDRPQALSSPVHLPDLIISDLGRVNIPANDHPRLMWRSTLSRYGLVDWKVHFTSISISRQSASIQSLLVCQGEKATLNVPRAGFICSLPF